MSPRYDSSEPGNASVAGSRPSSRLSYQSSQLSQRSFSSTYSHPRPLGHASASLPQVDTSSALGEIEARVRSPSVSSIRLLATSPNSFIPNTTIRSPELWNKSRASSRRGSKDWGAASQGYFDAPDNSDLEDTADVFDGYSFKGRHSVIIDDEDDDDDTYERSDEGEDRAAEDPRIRSAEVLEPNMSGNWDPASPHYAPANLPLPVERLDVTAKPAVSPITTPAVVRAAVSTIAQPSRTEHKNKNSGIAALDWASSEDAEREDNWDSTGRFDAGEAAASIGQASTSGRRGNSSFTRRVVDRYMLAVSALKVEKYITTTARQAASASRRRNNAQFKCPVPGCDRTFTRHFNLRDHVRSHIEEYPFVCEWPNCNIGFANQRDCKRHYDLHDPELNQHVCGGCGKIFSRMDAPNHSLCSDGVSECRKNAASPSRAGPSNANPAPTASAPVPHPNSPHRPGTLNDYYSTSLAVQAPPPGPPEPINQKPSQFGLDRAARAVPHAVDTGIIPDQAGLASPMHSDMDGSDRPAGPNICKSTAADQFLHARSLPATFSANSSAGSHAQFGSISSAISGASGTPVNNGLGPLSLAPSASGVVPSLVEVELSPFSGASHTSPGSSSLPIAETSGTTQSQSAGNLASVVGGANSGGGAETLRRQSLLSPMIPGFPTDSAAGADHTPVVVKSDYSALGCRASLALNDSSTNKRMAAIGTTTPSSKIIDQLVQHGCLDITQDLNLSS
ncbi:hypothetical protein FS749_010580, partial [Ceratobasidium sp. UAMH 11750]